jgi:hypothetical protein
MVSETNRNFEKIKCKFDKPYLKKIMSFLDAVYLQWLGNLIPTRIEDWTQ